MLGSVSSTESLSVGKSAQEHQTPRKRSLHLSGEGGEVVGGGGGGGMEGEGGEVVGGGGGGGKSGVPKALGSSHQSGLVSKQPVFCFVLFCFVLFCFVCFFSP